MGRCLPLSVDGEVCDGFRNEGCAPGYWCDTPNDVCRTLRDLGEACDIDWATGCNEGLYCSGLDGLCHAKAPDGEDCWDHEECQSDYCYGSTPPGTCVSQCSSP